MHILKYSAKCEILSFPMHADFFRSAELLLARLLGLASLISCAHYPESIRLVHRGGHLRADRFLAD